MTKNRFEHHYTTDEAEVTDRVDAYVAWAQHRQRMLSSRPPVDTRDLPEGVELPDDKQGVLATFLRKS